MADEYLILANQLYGNGETRDYFGNTEYEAVIYGNMTAEKIMRGLLDNELWIERKRNDTDNKAVQYVRRVVIKRMLYMLKFEAENFIEKINGYLKIMTPDERRLLWARFSVNLSLRTPEIKQYTINEPVILLHWSILEALICDVNRYFNDIEDEKNEVIYCECEGRYTRINRNKHFRTKRHVEHKGGKYLERDLILCSCGLEIKKYSYVRHLNTINHNYRLKLINERGRY